MDEIEQTRQRIQQAAITNPPEPWVALAKLQVPGITEIGFAEDSDVLIVISSHMRELIDCRSGRVIARDTGIEHRSAWYGHHDLIAHGFGLLSGREIRLSGAVGGGLLSLTPDGWGATRVAINWPEESLILTSPYSSIHNADAPFWKIAITREPVGWGFSFSGDSLVAATADEVMVFGRAEG